MFFFDEERLTALAAANATAYRSAEPFPHIVIDDFLPDEALDRIIDEFPGPQEVEWQRFEADTEVKLATDHTRVIPPFTRQVLDQFNSETMVDFLEQLTGIKGLIPDPHLWGGGLHQIERGGHLSVHSDFNWHEELLLDRRLNLILYLNRDWEPEWGGALELWDRDMTACQESVRPGGEPVRDLQHHRLQPARPPRAAGVPARPRPPVAGALLLQQRSPGRRAQPVAHDRLPSPPG